MWFINGIVDALDWMSDLFLDIYVETKDWVWPFYYISDPFYWLVAATIRLAGYFIDLGDFLEMVDDRVDEILDEWDIRSMLRPWLDMAEDAWAWVQDATLELWGIVDEWWTTTASSVRDWIATAEAWLWAEMEKTRGWLHEVRTWWLEFIWRVPTIDEIITWFGDWGSKVITSVITWGALTATQIGELIDSKISELPSFWEGWQEVKDQVIAFFSDPVEFIWERFTTWFLGPEA